MTDTMMREIEDHVVEAEREIFTIIDPRHFVEEYYRLADGVLAAQRQFLLRVIDVIDALSKPG